MGAARRGASSPHDASPPRQFSSSQRVSASPCRHCPAASLLCFASRRGCAQGGPAWLWLGAGAYQVTLLTELVLVVCHYPHLLLHDKAVLRELVVPRHVHRDLPPQERRCLRLRRACAPSLWAPHRFVHLRRPDEADQLAKLISDGRPRGGHGSSPRAVSERRDEQRSSSTAASCKTAVSRCFGTPGEVLSLDAPPAATSLLTKLAPLTSRKRSAPAQSRATVAVAVAAVSSICVLPVRRNVEPCFEANATAG